MRLSVRTKIAGSIPTDSRVEVVVAIRPAIRTSTSAFRTPMVVSVSRGQDAMDVNARNASARNIPRAAQTTGTCSARPLARRNADKIASYAHRSPIARPKVLSAETSVAPIVERVAPMRCVRTSSAVSQVVTVRPAVMTAAEERAETALDSTNASTAIA